MYVELTHQSQSDACMCTLSFVQLSDQIVHVHVLLLCLVMLSDYVQ